MPLLAADTETTGPIPTEARIVTAYMGYIDGSKVTDFQWLLNPGIEIPEGAAAVHGITTEIAQRDGTDYETGLLEIRDELHRAWDIGYLVCFYNASYDLTVIDTELRRLGLQTLKLGPTIDPYVIDRDVHKYVKGKRTLGVTAKRYGLDLENAHTADADALAGARIAWKLGRDPKAGDWLGIDATDLMARQEAAHMERQMEFRDYLLRKADEDEKVANELLLTAQENRQKATTVNGDWPIRKLADAP